MLAEHVCVVARPREESFSLAQRYLTELGFKVERTPDGPLTAKRGCVRPCRKVMKLPQFVQVDFDRGRVTMAASITPYHAKEFPIHEALLRTLLTGMEDYLNGKSLHLAQQDRRGAEAQAGSIWTLGEKITIGVCLGIIGLAVLLILSGVLGAVIE